MRVTFWSQHIKTILAIMQLGGGQNDKCSRIRNTLFKWSFPLTFRVVPGSDNSVREMQFGSATIYTPSLPGIADDHWKGLLSWHVVALTVFSILPPPSSATENWIYSKLPGQYSFKNYERQVGTEKTYN